MMRHERHLFHQFCSLAKQYAGGKAFLYIYITQDAKLVRFCFANAATVNIIDQVLWSGQNFFRYWLAGVVWLDNGRKISIIRGNDSGESAGQWLIAGTAGLLGFPDSSIGRASGC